MSLQSAANFCPANFNKITPHKLSIFHEIAPNVSNDDSDYVNSVNNDV